MHPERTQTISTVPYRRLENNEIRLIDFGAWPGSPVLKHANLADEPRYDALSYVWGTENCLHCFEINDQFLLVTSSLYVAFQEFKRRGYKGQLWADAVCINQADTEEKSVQIPLMSSIYQNAWSVIAWLGPGSSSHVIDTGHLLDLRSVGMSLSRKSSKVIRHAIGRASLLHLGHRMWDDLCDLISSPWVHRLWTFPEAVLNQSLFVWFGHYVEITWSTLAAIETLLTLDNAERLLVGRGVSRIPLEKSLVAIYNLDRARKARFPVSHGGRRTMAQHTSFPALLSVALNREVTRKQDKLYALYSLTSEEFRSLVPIDVDADPARVFIRAAKAAIMLEQDITILAYAESSNRLPGLPSWVPDIPTSTLSHTMTGFCGFNAGRWNERGGRASNTRAIVADSDENDSLHILGFEFDTIKAIVPSGFRDFRNTYTIPAARRSQARQTVLWLRDCRTLARSVNPTFRADDDTLHANVLGALAMTLVCNRPEHTRGKKSSGEKLEMNQNLIYIIEAATACLQHRHAGLLRSTASYYRSLCLFASARTLFTTRRGSIGLGPAGLRVDDKIAVFYNGDVPMALRELPAAGLERAYTLLGECYIDGVMDGEALHPSRKRFCGPDRYFKLV